MAEIIPINGIRYKSGGLSKLICPPYDVISEDEHNQLLSFSEYNFVRIEAAENLKSANKLFNSWLNNNILTVEREPALYIYQQKFTFNKDKLTRTGFLCATKLDPSNTLRHEKTTNKPIEQRLNLLKELKANTSPVFCLFPDKDKSISKIILKITKSRPTVNFKDRDGITHRLWALIDGRLTAKLSDKFKKKYLMIADGHHRYKTGLMYREYILSRKVSGKGCAQPYDYILTYLCAIEDPGLLILPTHRVVKKYTDLQNKINKYFNIKPWNGKSKPHITCFCEGEFKVLELKNKNVFRAKTRLYRSIPAIVLQKLVLDDVNPEDIFYTKNIDEAVRRAQSTNSYAFLLESPSLDSIFDLSRTGEIMPPKTTYFYPKVPAGLVVYSLKT